MNIAIVGYSEEGKSAYRYFKDKGEITICDKDADITIPEGVSTRLGDGYLEGIDEFDLVVVTAGAPLDQFPGSTAITSVTEEFFKRCKVPIIGVTGTKGKGTTSTLITKILETADNTVHLGGNIGVPALDLLPDIKKDDLVVLELSSFQLDDLMISPHVAVVLPVKSDHLDYHKTRDKYVEAKANIAKHQTQNDVVIFHEGDETARGIANYSKGSKQPYLNKKYAHLEDDELFYGDEEILKTSEIGLIGPHNLENVCAAVTAAWNFTQDKEAISHALSAFHGLEHRLEFVAEIDGVEYYNDSFSTAETAAIAAVRSFQKPIVLVAGGYDKGATFESLAKEVTDSTVSDVLLIGENRDTIKQALIDEGFSGIHTSSAANMEEIVLRAKGLTEEGSVVVFSPASASFDMFQNYKDRGVKFKEAVLDLA